MLISVNEIKPNPNNPRLIKGNKFKQLVKSIKEFPEMLHLRPIVVNKEMTVLGGNMRLKACIDAGLKKVPISIAEQLTPEQEKEFIIKDNSNFGEWDFDILANEWDVDKLDEWGLDVDFAKEGFEFVSKNILAPYYEPKNEKPDIKDLYDNEKTNKLIEKIESSNLSEKEKSFLKIATQRHTVFNYKNIADFYSHSNKEVQKLMEDSALVLIDLHSAISQGFLDMSFEFKDLYIEENKK